MNTIEAIEKKSNSQLLKDIVIALPDDQELDLNDRIEITHRIIERMEWVKNGLGVQIDIHQPHDGEKNWHAHLLLTTRRFSKDGKSFGEKARDLNPEFKSKGGNNFIIAEQIMIHEHAKEVINEYFKELGLTNRVDAIGEIPQEHLGPVRMRKAVNLALIRNEERVIANIESLDSGKELLRRLTKTLSVFSVADMKNIAKIIPSLEERERIINEALARKELIKLCDEHGKENGLYTTKEVREEEKRILRLGEYLEKKANVLQELKGVYSLNGYNNEQQEAITKLVTAKGGIRILKGRAGTGKSRVLGKLAEVASGEGVEIIGLAPTNKAKSELEKVGYTKSDTVKGFMFKLMHGRVKLNAGSIVVVDEAGMVGNGDYAELMREVVKSDSNLILAGDERQLTSVERGQMFELLAEKHPSCLLSNIERQSVAWAREVANSFAVGEVTAGIAILEENNGLYTDDTAEMSMARLLTDWDNNQLALKDKLIITARNKDVAALNSGARELLKSKGILAGQEYRITDKENKEVIRLMVGERIVFSHTNKSLGINNGDFGRIEAISKEEIRIKLDKQEEIVSFEPKIIAAMKYGYASTIYKAQGASIRGVYVLHNGASGLRNSYVALSRHIEEVRLYSNNEQTKNRQELIRQLARYGGNEASLVYYTKEEIEKKAKEQEDKGLIGQLVAKASRLGTRIVDNYKVNREYYQYQREEVKYGKIEEVVEKELEEVADYVKRNEQLIANKQILVGGYAGGEIAVGAELSSGEVRTRVIERATMVTTANMAVSQEVMQNMQENRGISSEAIGNEIQEDKSQEITSDKVNGNEQQEKVIGNKQSSKEKFYARAEYRQQRNLERIKVQEGAKESYKQEIARLRQVVNHNAENIARILLGEENARLSNGASLRYGEHGKVVVSIRGEKAGTWYDFASSKGGDMFDLVQEVRGGDFKQAVEYLQQVCGISREDKIEAVKQEGRIINYEDHLRRQKENRNEQVKSENEQEIAKAEGAKGLEGKEQEAKEVKLAGLIARSKRIGDKTIAYRYLQNERKIDCGLSEDIKTTGIYISELNKSLPAIVAFARNDMGEITGGQQIILDSETGKKAEIAVNKRSFGKISGSFVEIAKQQEVKEREITIIAEGIETALSIKQAGIDANIYCLLGVSNIRNYPAKEGEYVIIASDNDGKEARSKQTIAKAVEELTARKAVIAVVEPKDKGDFNDILQEKGKETGAKEIKELFAKPLACWRAKTISELADNIGITEREQAKLKEQELILIKYHIKQEKIIESFHRDISQGAEKLEAVSSNIGLIEQVVDTGKADKLIAEISILWDKDQTKGLTKEQVKLALIAKLHSGVIERVIAEKGTEAKKEAEIVTKDRLEEKDIIAALAGKRDELVKQLVINTHREFMQQKAQVAQKAGATGLASICQLVEKEQQALAAIYQNHREGIESAYKENPQQLQALQQAGNKELVQEVIVRANKLVANNVMPEDKIMTYFVGQSDIHIIHKDLLAEVNKYKVNKVLDNFVQEKDAAKNSQELFAVIKEEHSFLSQLREHELYRVVDSNVQLRADNAYRLEKGGIANKLSSAMEHIISRDIVDESSLFWKVRKDANDLETLSKDLTKICENDHIASINKNLREIRSNNPVVAGSKKFTNVIEYLKHELEHPPHQFVDSKKIQNAINIGLQKKKERDFSIGM